ncbi:11631_t:CDS:2 [Funneliformis mosseae]|uniref:11631_t:CDS:1 n=1 Tax=Funneliformis mosseae TaxID=27381 RepID=A0A9N9D223_FUNMO|nr:11631_t:CDS:2 [Funneliformis mosseae]
MLYFQYLERSSEKSCNNYIEIGKKDTNKENIDADIVINQDIEVTSTKNSESKDFVSYLDE